MTPSRRVCTIIARNYWAHARVLARSLHDVDPSSELTVLVVDADRATVEAASRESFDVLTPRSIGLSRDEIHRMAAIYDVMELSTALKPWLMRTLLERDASPVVYLDPDIRVFAPLDDAFALATEHGIVLTPHSLAPLPSDKREPSELTMLVSGIYNLGFIALSHASMPFIDWWAERLRRNALNDQPNGMFVDQRWVDLASSYFEPFVVRDPGYNVAFWNLPSRDVSRADGSYVVATASPSGGAATGSPLSFFHFSGFDPREPARLTRFQGADPRVRLEVRPVVAELCERYATELLGAGYLAHVRTPYGFVRSLDGVALEPSIRRAYRDELLRSDTTGDGVPPDPFDPDEAREFRPWISDVLRAPIPEPAGVNIIGYVHAENGVGEGARMLTRALDAAGVKRSVLAFDATDSRQDAAFEADDAPEHPVNIVCVNADQFRNFANGHADLLDGRYTIGVWNWEVERLPDEMATSAELVDEIWVSSEHTANAVRAATDKPVFVSPIPVEVRPAPERSRAELGLTEGFVFLFCFDFDSVFERKNPIGVIEAFSRAFTDGDGPQLIIKSVRGDAHPEELAALRAAASSRSDIHAFDGYVSSDELRALMVSSDAYVSLHRAEGYGLTIAEAMSYGKPVVATAYSGNLEFMDETNSWPVGYDLVQIAPGSPPYPTDARWAEPDLDAAAVAMREIVSDPSEAKVRGERAAADIARLKPPAARASFLLDRLEAIAEARPAPPPPPPAPKPAMEPVRPVSSVALAEIRSLIEAGPDLDSSSRAPKLSRRLRRFVLRLLRHHDEHRERLDEAFISAIDEVHVFEQEVRDEMWKLYRLEHRTDDVATRSAEVAAALDEALERVRVLEGRLRQERRLRRDLEERLGKPDPSKLGE